MTARPTMSMADFSLPVPSALVEAVAARALELLERRAATDTEPWIGVNEEGERRVGSRPPALPRCS